MSERETGWWWVREDRGGMWRPEFWEGYRWFPRAIAPHAVGDRIPDYVPKREPGWYWIQRNHVRRVEMFDGEVWGIPFVGNGELHAFFSDPDEVGPRVPDWVPEEKRTVAHDPYREVGMQHSCFGTGPDV